MLLPFDVFCFILFLLPFEHFALLITYWLLALHTVLQLHLHFRFCLLCAQLLYFFLIGKPCLLTLHVCTSARLHGTSYCILLSNYYLFAYSYNTLSNHAYYHVSYWQSPSHRPVFSPKPLHILLLFLHPFHLSLPLPTHEFKVFYDFYHKCDLNHIYCDFFHL